MRALLVFCEGNHDITFVRRSLGAIQNLTFINDKIKDLPSPFGATAHPKHPSNRSPSQSFIIERYSDRTLEEDKLSQAAHAPAPVFVCALKDTANDQLVLLLRCSTDSDAPRVGKLLAQLSATLVNGAGGYEVTSFAVAFVFDADTTVANRERTFRIAYTPSLGDLTKAQHGAWIQTQAHPVGLYILSDPQGNGTLEDVLAPQVARRWPGAWSAADALLTAHTPPGAPALRTPAERLKAQMTITGQPYFPGDPLSVVLDRDTNGHGLPPDAFQGPTSQALVQFLQSAPFTP